MQYITYYRTSTQKQTLGLAAQQTTVNNFLSTADVVIASYTEQESGTKSNRKELTKAIAECKESGATLLIANLSRLSRNAKFTFELMESKVRFLCCDMPNANTLTIGIMAVIAQDFATTLSDNTKKGLQAAKNKGVKLGTNNLTIEGAKLSAARRREQATTDNHQATKIIVRLRNEKRTYNSIARELNADGYRTSKGNVWQERSVQKMYVRATK